MMKAVKRDLHLFGGRSHPQLTAEVAKQLEIPLGRVSLGNFANGEISCRLGESVRGDDVFILQSHAKNINDALIEQAIMIDAAKRASAASITAICPFLGYARQDRKSSGREPITARLIVNILATAGADRIMSIDLHSGQIQGFFDGPFDHLIAMPTLCAYVQQNFEGKDLVIVSPDAGRVKMAERYSSVLNCPLAIILKHRSTSVHNTVEARYFIGDVKDKTCIIIDDMVDTAGTICAAADLLAKNGAKAVYGVATHGVLSDPALERIEKSAFTKVIVSDTLPMPFSKEPKKIKVLSIAPLVANAIEAVYTGASVSALFNGQNQM
jgi:ribose-phosphate pyrophosphokinase